MGKQARRQSNSPLTRELVEAIGSERKAVAESIGKTRDWLDKIARGEGRMSVDDAERIAPRVGLTLELVDHDDPVSEFRRALVANKLGSGYYDSIMAVFRSAKTEGLTQEIPPRRPRRRADAFSESSSGPRAARR